jgi:glycosyltransferase involved in cell wall biosynthesis
VVVTGWPSVGVVLPTHDRPELLRLALRSVLAQDYPGALEVVVVYDRAEPDPRLLKWATRHPVRIMRNARTPGLAGARNTGILALDTDLVAFCDDDDEWLPQKLTRQVCRLLAETSAEMVTCGIEVAYDDQLIPRRAGADEVRHEDLVRSRMAMLHSSTFLLRYPALMAVGMVAEDAPGSHNEDYDLLLRVARRQPVQHVDDPLVRVRWGATSHFASAYQAKIESLEWMLDRHPELAHDGPGSARIYGQLACWYAAGGADRPARRWAGRALRARWREPRAMIALAATAGVVRVETVLTVLHRRGRGI